MNDLIEIPADSRMGLDIARMEEVLRRLRDAAINEGVADVFSAHDAYRGGKGVGFSDLYTSIDALYDFQPFYRYYGIEWRSLRYGESKNIPGATSPGPQWVKFSTEDRRAWLRAMPSLLTALEGLPVSVTPSTSWRWDHKNPRANGRPTYVPVYEAMVSLTNTPGASFKAERALPSLVGGVCAADHPLADTYLFDWQADACGTGLFNSYHWTSDGFVATFCRKAAMEQAMEQLFAGFETRVEAFGKGGGRSWQVTVTLPDAGAFAQVPMAEPAEA